MLVTWKYKNRHALIQRFDPRTLVIFMLCMMFATIQIWDLRWLLGLVGLALAQLVLARLRWNDVRRFVLIIALVALALSLMTLATGRGQAGVYETEHFLWRAEIPIPASDVVLQPSLSVERLVYMAAQILRVLCFALTAIVLPLSIAPEMYGVTFRRLGLPDKFAYAMDLAFRFIPTLGRDFGITLDAQRARGYELERLGGASLVQRVRSFAPLLIPVTIHAIVGSEEIVDAMDLRCFGTGPRTWVTPLRFQPRDWAFTALSLGVLLGATALNLSGHGGLWVPDWLLRALMG